MSEDVPEAPPTTRRPISPSARSSVPGNTRRPQPPRAPRASAEHAATNGRVNGTALAEDAGALLATADGAVLTTTAPMPEIRYFAPPSSLTQMTEVPVQTDGNSERDRLGLDDDPDHSVSGPQRDELWVTPDTREALIAPYLVSWRTKIERLGTLNFPQAAWRAPGTRNPDVEVAIASDGTLNGANPRSSGSANSIRPWRHIETRESVRSFPEGTRRQVPAVAFHIRISVRRRKVGARGRDRARGFTVKSPHGGITSLSNHLLIAMPQLTDPNFSQTVSLICEHGEKGALGIVLNRPLSMTLSEVFEQMKIEPSDRRGRLAGPARRPCPSGPRFRAASAGRRMGFHAPDFRTDPGHHVPRRPRRHGGGHGTRESVHRARLRWLGSGQLEKEMLDNSWLSVPADESVIFDLPYEERGSRRSGCSASNPRSSLRSPVMPERRSGKAQDSRRLRLRPKRIGIASGDTLSALPAPFDGVERSPGTRLAGHRASAARTASRPDCGRRAL